MLPGDWLRLSGRDRKREREGERELLLPINRSVAVTKASSHHLHRRAEHLLTLSAYLLHSVSEHPQSTQPTTPSPPSLFHLLIFYFFPRVCKAHTAALSRAVLAEGLSTESRKDPSPLLLLQLQNSLRASSQHE